VNEHPTDPRAPGDGSAAATAPSGSTQPATGRADGADPLVAVRASLEDVLELPLPERAEVFEQAHRVVVAELRALELG